MQRRTLALAFLALAFAGPACAEGGDIIVVEPDQKMATQAANTDAEQALAPHNRSLLVRMVSYGCTRKGRTTPEFMKLSKQYNRDVAQIYCQCFAARMIDKLTVENIKTIIATHKADAKLQSAMVPDAQACLDEATAR